MYMTGKRTSLSKSGGFTLLELLTVIAIISILVMISVPVYRNAQKNAEKTVFEYNVKIIASVLDEYMEEQREEGTLNRTTIRELTTAPIGDPNHPLHGRIEGSELDETWIVYVNVNYKSQDYEGFQVEWKDYRAEYSRGKATQIENISQSE